jgi:integrase
MTKSVVEKKTRNRWYLKTNDLYKGERPTIEWGNVLPAGVGTKHQRAYLMGSFKGLVSAMVEAPREQKGPVLAHGTVLNWVFMIQRMVRWMVTRDLWRFSALVPTDVLAYIKDCTLRDDGKRVAEFTLSRRIAILQEMWELREFYVGGLRVNPAVLPSTVPVGMPRKSSWRPLDEPIALSLIGDAIRWLNNHRTYLLSVLQRSWDFDRVVGRTVNKRKKARSEFYKQISSENGFKSICSDLLDHKKTPYRMLIHALTITEGACVVLILFLVGMRIRELTRLDAGCVKTDVDSYGQLTARLHGVAAKQDGKARTWISCAPVNEAISYLEQSNAPARRESRQTALFINRNRSNIPSPGFRTWRTRPDNAGARMVAFARSTYRIGTPPIPRLHPHVARKTFARFVVLRDKRALESLSYHFGHVHRSITDTHYVGSDIELESLLEEEGRKDLGQGLTDLLDAPFVGGKAGQALLKVKHAHTAKFRGRKATKSLVEKLIKDGVQLAPCDWGYCVYSQALSACLGDAKGPNESKRSPDVCSSCANFAVTDRHRAWWEKRYERDDQFLLQADLPEQTVRWVEQRRTSTAKILSGLNEVAYDQTKVGDKGEDEAR